MGFSTLFWILGILVVALANQNFREFCDAEILLALQDLEAKAAAIQASVCLAHSMVLQVDSPPSNCDFKG